MCTATELSTGLRQPVDNSHVMQNVPKKLVQVFQYIDMRFEDIDIPYLKEQMMSYLSQKAIATGVVNGITVTIREGLNTSEDWELRLEVPKEHELFERFDKGEYVYDKIGNMYFAEDEVTGQCRFFVQTDNTNGFGGSTYKLQMSDGSVAELKGPWSSRCGVMNRIGFIPSMEVNIESRYNMASAMSVEAIKKLINPLGYDLEEHSDGYDVCYRIVTTGVSK